MKAATPVTVASAVISPWSFTANPADLMAVAEINGGPSVPQIRGSVFFQDVPEGVWITVEVNGLPLYRPAEAGCPNWAAWFSYS